MWFFLLFYFLLDLFASLEGIFVDWLFCFELERLIVVFLDRVDEVVTLGVTGCAKLNFLAFVLDLLGYDLPFEVDLLLLKHKEVVESLELLGLGNKESVVAFVAMLKNLDVSLELRVLSLYFILFKADFDFFFDLLWAVFPHDMFWGDGFAGVVDSGGGLAWIGFWEFHDGIDGLWFL